MVLRGEEELEWIRRVAQVPHLETRHVESNYRQSKRLQGLAGAVFAEPPQFEASDDPSPILAEHLTGAALGQWLADRIVEVERHVGRLPSIAVFVDAEERIDEVIRLTSGILHEENIRIVGCREGRDVGQDQEVRVFDVKHIKGLEFEAFFLGVDRLAERLPDLFRQYIYVGVTRTATFLGICCDGSLPAAIEQIRPCMSQGTWG